MPLNVLHVVEHRADRRRHEDHQLLRLADGVLQVGDLLVELRKDIRFARREPVRRAVRVLRERGDAAVAVRIHLGNDLHPLELAHDRPCRGDKVALIHIHGVELKRAAAILRQLVIVVGERHRALVESLVAVVACHARGRDARHTHRVAAVIFHVHGVALHPARCCLDAHLLVERLLENLCHLKRIDCHKFCSFRL